MVGNHATEFSKTSTTVLIVGAGPVGLLTALRLGQEGIDTLVIESHKEPLFATRAVVYAPVVNPALAKLGLLDRLRNEGYLNRDGIYWRDIDGKVIGHLEFTNSSTDKDDGAMLLLGQYRLGMVVLDELKKYPSVEVCFGWKCGGIEDVADADDVKVLVYSPKIAHSDTILQAKYVLGTDGANSTVRRLSCIKFDGFSFSDFNMIGADVIYDFAKEQDFGRVNFVVHPQAWGVVIYTGQDAYATESGPGGPEWRLSYSEPSNLPSTEGDFMRRATEMMTAYTQGRSNFQIRRAEPYMVSQRCASQARKGRVLLAGDALHSNNPIGGLGLTGGILDAFCYGNAFVRVIQKGQSDELLTRCANSRRDVWLQTTNKMSQANLNRLKDFDSEGVKARDAFFNKIRTDNDFPKIFRTSLDGMMPETFE